MNKFFVAAFVIGAVVVGNELLDGKALMPSEEGLLAAINSLEQDTKSQLPKMLESSSSMQVRIDKITGKGNKIDYFLTKMSETENDTLNFDSFASEQALSHSCNNMRMRYYLSKNITIVYHYSDVNGQPLSIVSLSDVTLCPKNN